MITKLPWVVTHFPFFVNLIVFEFELKHGLHLHLKMFQLNIDIISFNIDLQVYASLYGVTLMHYTLNTQYTFQRFEKLSRA